MYLSSSANSGRKLRYLLLIALIASFSAAWATVTPATPTYAAPVAQVEQNSPGPMPAPYQVTQGGLRYFPQTAHFLRGIFLSYWQGHGATDTLGLPITEAIVENGMTVQYLERARLEWHPEVSSDPQKQVLLSRLGAILVQTRGLVFDRLASGSDTPTSVFFEQTGHNLANAFLTYWQSHGGLAVFGYPISEEIRETNEADGQEYTVQYFERNRFEWHPERGAANNVQLGLLGVEYARDTGLTPLERLIQPGSFQGGDQDMSNSPQLAQLVTGGLLPAVQALGKMPEFEWVPAIIVKYNIAVEFQSIGQQDVAGAFVTTRSTRQPYLIIVPQSERNAPIETLESVLAHEATHAYDTVAGAINTRQSCSVDAELRAFMNGMAAWVLARGNDALGQQYDQGSFAQAINDSLLGFNNNNTSLQFDFNVQAARDYIRSLYGSQCGP